MATIITKEQFIKEAQEKHGEKYDYSKVVDAKKTDKRLIICPKHGEFKQTYREHIVLGYGCRLCGKDLLSKKYRKDQNDIIERFKKVHGDRYDYSKVEYVNMHKNVTIICPIHGEFEQTPHNHLKGYGCRECYMSTKRGNEKYKEEFIKKANNIHNGKYDYSLVEYYNNRTKVKIICPIHGEFEQTPSDHIAGCGCRKCGVESRAISHLYTTEEFIEKSKIIHNDKYDYSLVNYVNYTTLVKIICPIHGVFQQTPREHLDGCGCQSCSTSKLENDIKNLLSENNIDFIPQYNEKIFSRQRIDFFIPSKRIAIECQGQQHFFPFSFSSKSLLTDEENLFKTINLDKRKKEICEKLGYKIFYYTKKHIVPEDLFNSKRYKKIYDEKNIFFTKDDILKKIIEE